MTLKRFSIVFILGGFVGGALIVATFPSESQCTPPETINNNTITCTGAIPANQIGDAGDDTITIDNTVNAPGADLGGDFLDATDGVNNDTITNNGTVGAIYGDSYDGDGYGNDTITNNGTVNTISGDSNDGDGFGNDIITNNGIAGEIYGDSPISPGSGNDTIINNGTVLGDMSGDTGDDDGSGADILINNGTIGGNLVGDSDNGMGSGSDTIVNTGTVNLTIYGDSANGTGPGGNDTIINSGSAGNIIAGGGDDAVTIQTGANVDGIIDGGIGYDALGFNIESADEAELMAWADQIFAANPAGGTLTFGTFSYTWTNFEELIQLLRQISINGDNGLIQAFCRLSGNIDIYRIVGNEGELAFTVTPLEIANALAVGENTLIKSSGNLGLWALSSGELQLNAPNYDYRFVYQSVCGALPDADGDMIISVQVSDDFPLFGIINRPYIED